MMAVVLLEIFPGVVSNQMSVKPMFGISRLVEVNVKAYQDF